MDYKHFFGLKEAPFHLTPDPAYFFPSDAHREGLQTLLYSIRAGEGFAQITGDPGTGKTLLIRTILKELGEDVSTALIFNPGLSPHELLRALLEDLGLDSTLIENLSREALIRKFRDFLLNKARMGQRVVVIIDEAQNLPLETLEELRLLSNLETEKEKLLQIILVGQRELEQKLSVPEISQLHQRITIRYRLEHLIKEDIQPYIFHRLKIATPEERNIAVTFTPGALAAIFKISRGIPRLINIVCERSLMAAYVEGTKTVGIGEVKRALSSILGNNEQRSGFAPVLRRVMSSAAVFIIVAGLGLLAAWQFKPDILMASWSLLAGEGTLKVQSKDQFEQPPLMAFANRHKISLTAPAVSSDATTAEIHVATDKEPPAQPVAPHPQDALLVAPGAYFVLALIDTGQIRIWQGTENGPKLIDGFEHQWPYGEGLFMVGHDVVLGSYIFNHAAYLKASPTIITSSFWNNISSHLQGNVVPLLARANAAHPSQEHLALAQGAAPVFERFIHTWKNMLPEDLFDLYGNIITSHHLDPPRTMVLSREQAYLRRKDVFNRSGFINLDVSRPVFMMDPSNSKSVKVVYHQKYNSRIWQDEGTKVLYFSLQNTGRERVWKVTGELWIAD